MSQLGRLCEKILDYASGPKMGGTTVFLRYGNETDGFEDVQFDDVIVTPGVPTVLTGAQTISVKTWGADIAAADSTLFEFRPKHFKPQTDREPPAIKQLVQHAGKWFQLHNVTGQDMAGDTQVILAYGFLAGM